MTGEGGGSGESRASRTIDDPVDGHAPDTKPAGSGYFFESLVFKWRIG